MGLHMGRRCRTVRNQTRILPKILPASACLVQLASNKRCPGCTRTCLSFHDNAILQLRHVSTVALRPVPGAAGPAALSAVV